jgi:hypothetical protein
MEEIKTGGGELFGDFWTFGSVWNKSLEEREERPVRPRDHLWASELGKSPVDIFLKLKGEPLTNPPNARSMRKFEAGNIWEWIVGMVLTRAGILLQAQEWVSYQYPGLLEVTGKADFIAGGTPDFDKAKREIDSIGLPDVFKRAFKNIVAHLESNYPNGLHTKVLEVKSLSAFMYDGLERTGKASKIHRLQTYHYLKSKGIERGDVVYVCRDDCRMMEIPVYLNSEVEQEYKDEIATISHYVKMDQMPKLERPIVFDKDLKKFAKNFNVAYSGYLTKLYGFKDQAEFDDRYQPMSEKWNRVLGRVKTGKPMTAANKVYLAEMTAAGFDVDSIIQEFTPDEAEEEIKS